MSNAKLHNTRRGDERLMWVCLTVDRLWADRASAPGPGTGRGTTLNYAKQYSGDGARDVAAA